MFGKNAADAHENWTTGDALPVATRHIVVLIKAAVNELISFPESYQIFHAVLQIHHAQTYDWTQDERLVDAKNLLHRNLALPGAPNPHRVAMFRVLLVSLNCCNLGNLNALDRQQHHGVRTQVAVVGRPRQYLAPVVDTCCDSHGPSAWNESAQIYDFSILPEHAMTRT